MLKSTNVFNLSPKLPTPISTKAKFELGLDPTCFPNLPKNQTRNTILAPKFERNFKRRIIEINFKQKQQFFNPTLLICHNSFDICKKKVISS